MTLETIFTLLGGLGLFFLGMRTMSDSLRRVASEGFRSALEVITRRPILGLLIGTAVTALVQSSSATTVMTVGFVNAGLLTLRQAISIILGANIGTTLTAWLVSFLAVFRVTRYSLPAIGVGMILTMVGRTQKLRRWGQFLLGFGLLFTGLGFIRDAFGPLQEQGYVRSALERFGSYPLLGILLGMAVTVILQSSSATIALLQLLAFTGVIDFATAIPIILGENIGTTITAELSAIGTNLNARRTARSHALLNIFGVCYMIVPVYLGWYERLILGLVPGPITRGNVMIHIALAHTTFNLINSLAVFLPSIRLLERAAVALTPKRKGTLDLEPKFLERHLLDSPGLAIQQAIKELIRMTLIAREAITASVNAFFRFDPALEVQIRRQETAIDMLQKEITQYLVEVSERHLDSSDAETLPVLLHSVNDVERIGDHAENIIELAVRKQEQKLEFSEQSLEELHAVAGIVDEMTEDIILTLSRREAAAARRVLARETRLNEMQVSFKDRHVDRLQAQECHILSGLMYVSLVDNLEKIGDHLTNIAMASLRRLRWDLEPEIEERPNDPEVQVG